MTTKYAFRVKNTIDNDLYFRESDAHGLSGTAASLSAADTFDTVDAAITALGKFNFNYSREPGYGTPNGGFVLSLVKITENPGPLVPSRILYQIESDKFPIGAQKRYVLVGLVNDHITEYKSRSGRFKSVGINSDLDEKDLLQYTSLDAAITGLTYSQRETPYYVRAIVLVSGPPTIDVTTV